MATDRMTVRLDPELKAELVKEAKQRGQTEGALVRTFVRDGLSGYDALSERILQMCENGDERIRRLETMVGAVIHLLVEEVVLSQPRQAEESQEDYATRLRGLYADKVRSAADRGAPIKSVVKTPEK